MYTSPPLRRTPCHWSLSLSEDESTRPGRSSSLPSRSSSASAVNAQRPDIIAGMPMSCGAAVSANVGTPRRRLVPATASIGANTDAGSVAATDATAVVVGSSDLNREAAVTCGSCRAKTFLPVVRVQFWHVQSASHRADEPPASIDARADLAP